MKASDNEKSIYVLIGPPSVGKSTWVKNNLSNVFIVSRDNIVEQVASNSNFTYDDLFVNPDQDLPMGYEDEKFGRVVTRPYYLAKFLPAKMWDKIAICNKDINEIFEDRIKESKDTGEDIVVDMTNMNVKSRKGILNNFKDLRGYRKIAVNFNIEGEDVQSAIKEIAIQRAIEISQKGGSKTIPEHVMNHMFTRYEPPSRAEGFDEIIEVDDRARILNQAKKIKEARESI